VRGEGDKRERSKEGKREDMRGQESRRKESRDKERTGEDGYNGGEEKREE
jgi:hypothetical protein